MFKNRFWIGKKSKLDHFCMTNASGFISILMLHLVKSRRGVSQISLAKGSSASISKGSLTIAPSLSAPLTRFMLRYRFVGSDASFCTGREAHLKASSVRAVCCLNGDNSGQAS
jgi:hypothetical protein